MTEKELQMELMKLECYLRVDADVRIEPERDDEGAFVTNSWEWTDDGRWLWEQDEDGGWHRTGFRKKLFDNYVRQCIKIREEQLRQENNLPKPK